MTLGQIAYEACPDQPHKWVPWDNLSKHWQDYWTAIATAVANAVSS